MKIINNACIITEKDGDLTNIMSELVKLSVNYPVFFVSQNKEFLEKAITAVAATEGLRKN